MTFDAIFIPSDLAAAVSDEAWLEAMLEAERALANAEVKAGVISADCAEAISAACRPELFDIADLARKGHATGNPVEPLVRALRDAVGGHAADYVHYGATSQDVLDTAATLVTQHALALVDREVVGVAAGCARLADEHRETVMPARTLMQQAVPTTFGLKASGWLITVCEARSGIARQRLRSQLGGAAGTLSALGDKGPEVAGLFAAELGLLEPVVPWQSRRTRVAELGSALAIAASTFAKIGLDIAMLEQTEVGELSEPTGVGGSSTMPQKRNPVGSTLANASARHVRASSVILTEGIVGAHERSIGSWQAEWGALSTALAHTGGAAAAMNEVLKDVIVHADQMRANLELTGGAVMSERLSFLIAERSDRPTARKLI
ncbi:MAG TPA: lyase family protein, partial [Gaiellaceae bacterium]|nr:lyase family protein [Gaiellaceae bacterium]